MKPVKGFALVLTLMLMLPPPSFAAEFYAIVDSFGRKPLNAFLDVSVDAPDPGRLPEVIFEVYDQQGTRLTEIIAPTNLNGFASTFSYGNLFDYSKLTPLLVRARTPATASDHGASLHVFARGETVTVGALHMLNGFGTPFGKGRLFSVPLGSFDRASLLVANVSGTDVSVELFRGARQADGSGSPGNARLGSHSTWKVDLTANDAFSNVIVNSSNHVIVQVVIDEGKHVRSYMVPPSVF